MAELVRRVAAMPGWHVLMVYHAVYYLLPLTIGGALLLLDEFRQGPSHLRWASSALGTLAEQLTPTILAVFTFLGGLVLLFSGATPAAAGRLALLNRIVPLGVIEVSHFAGSVVGAALLLLSQGLARRLNAAHFLAMVAIATGMGASLLKGADYEEATVLALLLVVLWRARPAFNRNAAFFDTRFSAGWTLAVAGAVGASIWLGVFAFKHVEYSGDLWWQFELNGDVSRFLRASVGAAVALLLFSVARLLGFATHPAAQPTDADLACAETAIRLQTSTLPYLVFLRDKTLLFDEKRRGFVMYGIQGRTWAALGDPVGPPDCLRALIRAFLERVDDYGGVPVFYQVDKHQLHSYADFGLTFVKVGEEATVNLDRFTLEGGPGKKFRHALRHLEHERATFRIVSPCEVPCLMNQMRAVSDDWIRERATGEKGFSLGFFSPDYLSRFPAAIVERDGRVVAFANLWPGPDRLELSVDLMRHDPEAPNGIMDGLFTHLLVWGKAQGYRRFRLGMAPLSGFERSPVAPLWNRLGAFIYEHGETLYHFQGLRAYKEKFDPVWEPRYLVYPGGLRLPRILADIAALISGGYRNMLPAPMRGVSRGRR